MTGHNLAFPLLISELMRFVGAHVFTLHTQFENDRFPQHIQLTQSDRTKAVVVRMHVECVYIFSLLSESVKCDNWFRLNCCATDTRYSRTHPCAQ